MLDLVWLLARDYTGKLGIEVVIKSRMHGYQVGMQDHGSLT